MGVLAVLSGWSSDVSVGNAVAIGVLLCGQLTAVALGARLFARRTDGALIAFWMYGNPTFWTAPVAAATLGAHAAVFVIAYDMLTQSRIAAGIKYLRHRAPKPQSPRTALTDYAPALGAVAGLLLGLVLPAPDVIATVVARSAARWPRSPRCCSGSPGRSAGSAVRRSRSRCAASRCT